MTAFDKMPRTGPNPVLAFCLTLAIAATVGAALAFEHVGGFIPCALCLEQRTPYYIAIPLALVAALSALLRAPAVLTRALLCSCALLMLYGAGLGAYHAGVEWGFWPGPASCATSATSGIASDAGSLLSDLNAVRPPSCDAAAGRFLGLSFAGWNVLASLALAAASLRVAFTRDARGAMR
jgi:disulfide bond formation protein DsbB